MAIQLKYSGRCRCGVTLQPGTTVNYDKGIVGCPSCDGTLKALPPPSTSPTAFKVKIQGVTFKKPDGSFTIARAVFDVEGPPPGAPAFGGSFGVVGALGEVGVDDLIEVHGTWENKPRYGWQFKATAAARVVGSTLESLRAFLGRLPHVGRATAAEIIRSCGGSREAVLDTIENRPEELVTVKGITPDRAKQIQQALKSQEDLRESAMYLAALRLGEGLTAKILDAWGKDAKRTLAEDPYRLMQIRGVGFRTADDLAVGRLNVHPHDPRRAAAAVLHLLKEEQDEGHTWTPLSELLGSA